MLHSLKIKYQISYKMFPEYIKKKKKYYNKRNTISGIINILRFGMFIKDTCTMIRRIISN